MINQVSAISMSEAECQEICKEAFQNNIKKMQAVYEIRIQVAVLTKNLRSAQLYQRDLLIINQVIQKGNR